IEWSNSTPRGSPNRVDPQAKKIPIETRMLAVAPTSVVSRTPVASPTPTIVSAEPVFPRFCSIQGTIPVLHRNVILQNQQKSTKKRTGSTSTQQTIVEATKEPVSAKKEQVSAQKGSVLAQKGQALAQKVVAKPKVTNQLRPDTPPKARGNKMHAQQLARALPSVTDENQHANPWYFNGPSNDISG
ncbi:hypothetical protein RUND412_010860, partial [Rhizina undulata]